MDKNFFENENKQKTAPQFDFGRTSVICGVSGLLSVCLIFPAGMYIGFFLGVTGFACALTAKRESGRSCIPGLILCATSAILSLLFFLMILSFYEAIRDPVLGPRLSQIFIQLMDQSNLSPTALTDLLNQ
ncbi:MAG: hypothetical protein Q4C63_06250 [Eubacteriales bacterium]|nr:hypothetical protein [Eubacteriales bacterium]